MEIIKHLSTMLLFTLLRSMLCNANVYVTQPTTQTQWVAGTSVKIAWEDDGHNPLLKAKGHSVTISLFPSNKGLYPKPLAVWKNVDTRSQLLEVHIKPSLGSELPNTFFLQFRRPRSHITDDVYSARFSILPAEHNSQEEASNSAHPSVPKDGERIQSSNDSTATSINPNFGPHTDAPISSDRPIHLQNEASGHKSFLVSITTSSLITILSMLIVIL
ncbi:uncharacterized protein MELLADRAFT_63848 [Melampsora larici-populina 98AG31]|uniref:Yeast cell wall synthesis Kre9/Knh1-like N-terminal domain-containing protein n=1 Tax=Melampsora larici-populina (strain 98AG31 / pathotype 3-4-7) TaxID=747676 RepID=F4RPC9_MELLP|nr:uncharacterized protein MELLADRAFT_63848 [Melampsora larici-populina 98AG31]EGG05794.1 hypothetical protein MELLADRAFT_63848 [Melampsora larici-populina 98AG31]